jgi:hypothetical protein
MVFDYNYFLYFLLLEMFSSIFFLRKEILSEETFFLILIYAVRKSTLFCQSPRAHACNPSYSGVRDLEDHNGNPAWATSLQDPVSKKKKNKKPYH